MWLFIQMRWSSPSSLHSTYPQSTYPSREHKRPALLLRSSAQPAAALQNLMSGLLLVVGVQSHVIAVTCVIDLEWIYLSIHHLHHSPNRFLNHIFFLLASHRLLQSLLNFTIYDYTRTRHGHCHSHWLAATNYRITISLLYWTVVGLKSALEILSQFAATFCCIWIGDQVIE